jgi:hypothetical protein
VKDWWPCRTTAHLVTLMCDNCTYSISG